MRSRCSTRSYAAALRLFPDATVRAASLSRRRSCAAAVATLRSRRDELATAAVSIPLDADQSCTDGRCSTSSSDCRIADDAGGRLTAACSTYARERLSRGRHRADDARRRCRSASISVSRAPDPGPLRDKQIALLAHLRRPGGDRDRERAPVQGAGGAYRRRLTRSVEQLTALGEVGQAISSTLDLETVLQDDRHARGAAHRARRRLDLRIRRARRGVPTAGGREHDRRSRRGRCREAPIRKGRRRDRRTAR